MVSMKNNFLPTAYLNKKLIPFDEANISIATHALHYGTAAFAGMRVYPDKNRRGSVVLFRSELHIKRLARSAKLLGFEIGEADIKDAINNFIAANPGDKPYYLRPLVYASDLGVAPRLHDIDSDLLIYGVEMGDYMTSDGITCCFSSWTRGEDRAVPLRGKISGTYVGSALAKTEAVMRGFDEAVFLNSRGKLAEGSAMNLFMISEDKLITPRVTDDILEGITRRSIIELAGELGVEIQEREVDKSELLLADEAFLTGTAAQIAPILQIEQYKLSTKRPLTEKLRRALFAIISQEKADTRGWLTSYKAR
jgi:branched-chain amino acid aminotransferase